MDFNDKTTEFIDINNKTSLSSNSVSMVLISDRKAYTPITTCVINHVFEFYGLNNLEKLFYLLTDHYANLNGSINKGYRETEKSARQWSKLLNCSEEYVFKMQKKLEEAGYFHIIREIDEDNQNEKNIIVPTLPDNVFDELSKEPNRKGSEHLVLIKTDNPDYKRKYLDASKMFINFNLQMVKLLLIDNNLTSLQKLIWLHAFCRSYTAYIDSEGEGTRNFITTYQELAMIFNCSEKTISTAINNLSKHGYLSKIQIYIKEKTSLGRRKKKSCWELAALFPQEQMEILLKQPDRQNLAPLNQDDLRLYGLDSPNNHTNVSNLYNSSVGLGGSSDSSEYNNKYNILNTKNNVTEISDTTNIISAQNDFNVFIENKLIISTDELALGLNLAAKFEEKAFLKTIEANKLENLEETIKQADLTLTSEEHWLVTKTAFTLYQKLQTEIQSQYGGTNNDDLLVIKLKETLFTPTEQRLVELWESFSDLPQIAEREEFLLRKSWLLKLLPNTSGVNLNPDQRQPLKPIIKPQELPLNKSNLPGDKADKAKKFAKKLRAKGLANGYAANISTDDLAREFIYHAENWVPERLHCKTREEQIDAALSFAWKAAEQGKWKCPYELLNMQIIQREYEAAGWKNW